MEARPITVSEIKVNGKNLFRDWLTGLDKTLQVTVDKRLNQLRRGNLGKHRNLAGGVTELKMIREGLRIYMGWDNKTAVLLILGGGKGRKADQNEDIKLAQSIWTIFKASKMK